MAAEPYRCDVAVLGAGPAGLAAAWYAARRGLSVTVVERTSQVGGLAASFVVGGQTVDLGSHRLHPSIRADLFADLRDELRVELQWRARDGRIRLGGRWLRFPLRASDLARHAHPAFALGALRDTMWAPVRSRREPLGAGEVDSFARRVHHGLGPTVARSFYGPYATKLWAETPECLSAELFRRRVGSRSASTVIRKLFRREGPAGFWYPAAGFGAISQALADDLTRRGGRLLVGSEIEAVRPGDGHVAVDVGGGRTVVARSVISTIPSAALLRLIGCPPQVMEASRTLSFRGALLVYLVVPRAQYTPFDAHYFPEPSTIVSRLSEPKNYRTSSNDPTESTVLCAEVPATIGDPRWAADDEDLGRRVCRELVEQGLPDATPVSVHVERRSHVYPVYRLGFEEHRDRVDDYVDQWPDLAVVGRQALFAHDNTHHALLMGRAAADALRDDGSLDRERWLVARRSFEDHVVED